jgi:hypothetical protein
MKMPDEVMTILKNQNRDRDIRNAAICTWRHILDAKGGQAPQWDFINSIRMMAAGGRATILEPVEILMRL